MQQTGYIIRTKLTSSEFDCLLKSVSVLNSYLLTQQADSIKFTNFDQGKMLKTGRIFNSDYEIRYERLKDGSYDIMVFSEQKSIFEELKLSETLQEYDLSKEDDIFLWGKAKRIKDQWRFIEVQIPQILEYPCVDGLGDDDELVIKAIDYKRDELSCFTRFKGVEVYVPGSR